MQMMFGESANKEVGRGLLEVARKHYGMRTVGTWFKGNPGIGYIKHSLFRSFS